MEESDFIFKGKRFKYLKDFEQEFKPTKWSIRKFLTFTKDFLPHESLNFEDHTIKMLTNYSTTNKDTLNFIKQIYDKRTKQANLLKKELFETVPPILPESKDGYEKIIKLFVILQKDGIIEGNLREVADFIKLKFSVKLSISTIRSKIYEFSEELKEETFNRETFKNFH